MRRLINFPLIASIITAILIMVLLEINASMCDGECLDFMWLIEISILGGFISGYFFVKRNSLFAYLIRAILYSFIFAAFFELSYVISDVIRSDYYNLIDKMEEIIFSFLFAAEFNLGGYLSAVILKAIFERFSIRLAGGDATK